MIDLQEQVGRILQRAKSGSTVYLVCPNKARSLLGLVLLSQLSDTDTVNGKTYSVGKGTICMARPSDTVPAAPFDAVLVSFSEADPAEAKGMLVWRDKTTSVLS